jgi:hypothetical protein
MRLERGGSPLTGAKAELLTNGYNGRVVANAIAGQDGGGQFSCRPSRGLQVKTRGPVGAALCGRPSVIVPDGGSPNARSNRPPRLPGLHRAPLPRSSTTPVLSLRRRANIPGAVLPDAKPQAFRASQVLPPVAGPRLNLLRISYIQYQALDKCSSLLIYSIAP